MEYFILWNPPYLGKGCEQPLCWVWIWQLLMVTGTIGRSWKAFPKPGSCSPFDFPFQAISCSWSRLSSLIKSSKGKQEPGRLSQCIFSQWKRLQWHVKLVTDCSLGPFPHGMVMKGAASETSKATDPTRGSTGKILFETRKLGAKCCCELKAAWARGEGRTAETILKLKSICPQSKAHQSSDKKIKFTTKMHFNQCILSVSLCINQKDYHWSRVEQQQLKTSKM